MSFGIVASVVGSVGGALISSNASKKASKKAKKGTDAALAEQRRQYDLNRSDFAPYREAGTRALGLLETENNRLPTSEEVMSDPGYQFGLNQGQKALDRKQSALGGRLSGAALKGASEYATQYATVGYGAAYQRRQDRLNRLAAIAGIGQTSTANSAAAGSASTNAISGLYTNQADMNAAGSMARGNIWANTGNELAAMGKKWATPNSGSKPGVGDGGADGNGYYGVW